MELAEIRPFEPQMAEIDLFTMPDAVGVGEPSVRKQKPYIAGHVTDGSSTFTFKVNNADVTVPVDANGYWKWVVDKKITSLREAFYNHTNLDSVVFTEKCDDVTSLVRLFQGCNNLESVTFAKGSSFSKCVEYYSTFYNCSKLLEIKNFPKKIADTATTTYALFWACSLLKNVDLSDSVMANTSSIFHMFNGVRAMTVVDLRNATLEKVTNAHGCFYGSKNLTDIYLNNATFDVLSDISDAFTGCYALETIFIKRIPISFSFASCSKLTAQSIVNLFNAVSADGLTLTFHATVGAKIDAALEAGGEGTPEQNAIYNAYWDAYDRGYEINYTY